MRKFLPNLSCGQKIFGFENFSVNVAENIFRPEIFYFESEIFLRDSEIFYFHPENILRGSEIFFLNSEKKYFGGEYFIYEGV